MGFDWLFVNAVHRPGASGSVYSIVSYFDLNPALIDPADPRSGEDQLNSDRSPRRAALAAVGRWWIS
jgi:starch synthase (maltosyl-transferring)